MAVIAEFGQRWGEQQQQKKTPARIAAEVKPTAREN